MCYNPDDIKFDQIDSLSKIIRNVVKNFFKLYNGNKKGKQYNIDIKSQDLQVKNIRSFSSDTYKLRELMLKCHLF